MINKILPIILFLSGCAQYKIENNHPAFLDTKRGYARIYAAQKVTPAQCGDPNYAFKYTGKTMPISDMNGYVCLPASEVQYNLKYYNEYSREQAHCPSNLISEKSLNAEMQPAQ